MLAGCTAGREGRAWQAVASRPGCPEVEQLAGINPEMADVGLLPSKAPWAAEAHGNSAVSPGAGSSKGGEAMGGLPGCSSPGFSLLCVYSSEPRKEQWKQSGVMIIIVYAS